MKKCCLILMILLLASNLGILSAEEEAANSIEKSDADKECFGKEITLEQSTPLKEITMNPKEFEDKTVLVEGEITGTCPRSGCWVSLKVDEDNVFICRSIDHSVSFPKDCIGRHAWIQGRILVVEQESEEGPKSEKQEVEKEKEAGEKDPPEAKEETDHSEECECPAPSVMLWVKGACLEAD